METLDIKNYENTIDKIIPNPELDNGWDDADTVNENIFCPNPELGVMEECDPDNQLPDIYSEYPELPLIDPNSKYPELPLIDPYSQIKPSIKD